MENKEENNVNQKDSQKDTKKKATRKKSPAVTATKYKDIEGKFLLVRVGTDARPATSEQIKEIEEKLTTFLNDNGVNCMAFVTHHATDISVIGN